MNSEKVDYTFKILTLGESGVGKTCVLRRFTDNKFLKNHLATIGIDYQAKNIFIGNKIIKLKIWDTAGQDRFRNITQQYYKGADGIVLVFDVTDLTSFEKIIEWMNNIKQNTQMDQIGVVLLGNKVDLEPRAVSKEMGNALAKELNVRYYETSALNNVNINESFNDLTIEIMNKKKVEMSDPQKEVNTSIILTKKKNQDNATRTSQMNKEQKKGGCC